MVPASLASVNIIVELDGAPGTALRMTPPEIASADPGKLIVRMEGRLTALEALKAKTLAEITRLTAEASHARDDLSQPFPQAGKLTAARDRAQQIDEQLSQAAAPPRPAPEPPATTVPDWAPTAPRNPGDPRWLAAAAMHDAAVMAGIPGSSVAVITYPEPVTAAETVRRDFPEQNPLAAPAAGQSTAPMPTGEAPHCSGPRP